MTIEFRANRVALKISGTDATRLLHDVLTPPVVPDAEAVRWFALLSPQGKIAAEGLIGWTEDAYWLDVDEGAAAFFQKRMGMYRLRAEVDIENLGESHKVGWSAAPVPSGIVHKDPRGEAMGYRVITSGADAGHWDSGDGYRAARIANGICEMGFEIGPDESFPHDIGMDLLGGIDFKKGCYIGQEVVSRMQHRGTARRRPVIVAGIDGAQAGDALTIDGRAIGKIGMPPDGKAVAIVRIDKAETAKTARVGEASVQLALPQWARYGLGPQGDDS